MLYRNYIITAWRMVKRAPMFSVINVIGLAFGLACSLFIFIWIMDEYGYDKFHENRNCIYRLNTAWEDQPDMVWTNSPFPLGPALAEKFPFISSYTRVWHYPAMLKHEQNEVFDNNGLLVDRGFFRMFSFPVITRRTDQILEERDQVVLTESLSRKLFDSEDPLLKTVTINGDTPLTVVAVMADPPRRSGIQFSFLASIELLPPSRLTSLSMDVNTYIMTGEGSGEEAAGSALEGVYLSYDSTTTARIRLQPFSRIHMNEPGENNLSGILRLFGIIAVLVLMIACINYMNLSLVRSVDRIREISIRKINGAGSRMISHQFMLESALITLMALFLAFMLVEIFREPFNRFAGKELTIDYKDPALWLLLGGVYLVTVLFSGIYPAIKSGRFNPVQIMSNRFAVRSGPVNLRMLLVIFQYSISTLLIIAAITTGRQLHYITSADTGYKRKNILVVDFGQPFTSKFDLIREKILENPKILSVSGSSLLPSDVNWQVEMDWTGNESGEPIPIRYMMVDYDFIETMGMKMAEGRSFSRKFPSDDSIAYIVNETAVREMKMPDPVGKTIRFIHPDFPEKMRTGEIIGVVKDFHSGTFHHNIPPMVMRIYRPWYNYLVLKIDPADVPSTIRYLEGLVDQLAPGYPFDFRFFEDSYSDLYRTEIQTNVLIKLFALLAILISSLGILALSSYTVLRRTKEIGIRKANGAGSFEIIKFLVRENIRYVMISIAIALPTGFFLVGRWLMNFAYRIHLYWWILLVAALIPFTISLCTILFQILKKATESPVKSLRYE